MKMCTYFEINTIGRTQCRIFSGVKFSIIKHYNTPRTEKLITIDDNKMKYTPYLNLNKNI